MDTKEPDLEFSREYNSRWAEGIEFYLSEDDFLEIKTVNCDSDTFTIILSPDEIKKLRALLNGE